MGHTPTTSRLFLSAVTAALLSAGLVACSSGSPQESAPPEQTLENTVAPDGFDYATTRELNLTVTSRDAAGQPVANSLVEVFHSYDLSAAEPVEGEKVLTAVTDANGAFAGAFVVPTHAQSLRVTLAVVGMPGELELPLAAGQTSVSASFEPTGRESEASSVIETAANSKQADGYLTLGGWSKNLGLPDYLTNGNSNNSADISARLKKLVKNSFPEGKSVSEHHPEFLQDNVQSDLVFTDSAEVFVTFVHEEAGFKNTLGYYVYDPANPPKSKDDIENYTLIFPNASFAYKGGNLLAGDRVQLKYSVGTKNESTTFPAGSAVGWFIMSDGWSGNKNGKLTLPKKPSGEQLLFVSGSELNNDAKAHMILLFDEQEDVFIMGIEDKDRAATEPKDKSDHDFNDGIFRIEVSPTTALDLDDVPDADDGKDTDGDGVNDSADDYPNDPERAFDSYYPSESGYSTLAFEDRWPLEGDYDFNDMVVGYRFNQVLNAKNQVKDIKGEFVFPAAGAAYANAFAYELPVSPKAVESVKGTHLANEDGAYNYLQFNANGTEANQEKAVVFVTDDLSALLGGNVYIVNTEKGGKTAAQAEVKVDVTFVEPQAAGLFAAPYNPFIVTNLNGLAIETASLRADGARGVEVHLPNYAPTSLADMSYFGEKDDGSEPDKGNWYTTRNNGLPWALHVPGEFDHLFEREVVSDGYLHFIDWVASGGADYADWYLDKPGYRNSDVFYRP